MIHPTALVDSNAEIDSDVEIGPYSVIHGDVSIGAGVRIGARGLPGGHQVRLQGREDRFQWQPPG